MSALVARRSRTTQVVLGGGLLIGMATIVLLWTAGFLGGRAVRIFEPHGRRAPVAAVLFSGDMGLRFGLGRVVAQTLAARGIEVFGINSPALFGRHRSRREVDAIIANAVRAALRQTGTARLVLIGQSFGADMLQAGLVHLPVDLRRHIAAVVLVVPGEKVFYRADPTGFAYLGTPDSRAAATINRADWTPLTCIYGRAERDSACPAVARPAAWIVGMPGGHYLDGNGRALAGHVLAAIERAVPAAGGTAR